MCVVHFTFCCCCCYTIVFIIIVHAFILSTIPWNRIGSHNLFSFRSLCMGMLSSALLCWSVCAVKCNALLSVSTIQMRAMWDEKGTHNNSMKANKRQTLTQSVFLQRIFHHRDVSLFLFLSRVVMFLFEIDFCACVFSIPFSMHHSLHQGKGMTIAHSMHAELGSGSNVICALHGWESAFYEWVRCVHSFSQHEAESLGWNSKGNEYPRMPRYFFCQLLVDVQKFRWMFCYF